MTTTDQVEPHVPAHADQDELDDIDDPDDLVDHNPLELPPPEPVGGGRDMEQDEHDEMLTAINEAAG